MTLKVERKRHYHPTDWQKFKRLMMPRFDLDVKKLVLHTFFVGVNIGKAIFSGEHLALSVRQYNVHTLGTRTPF